MTEYAGLLMTEPLSATLLIGAVLAFLRASDDNDWRWAGATGLLAGALTLVRAEFIVLLLLLPLLALVRRPQELRAAALPAAAIALGAVLVIAPWTIRNASALDRFVPVSTGGGKTLYIGTNLEADGDAVKLRADLLAEYPQLAERLERRGPVDDPANYALERLLLQVAFDEDPGADPDRVLARLGREQLGDAITDHPGEFIGLLWGKTYDTWTQPARADDGPPPVAHSPVRADLRRARRPGHPRPPPPLRGPRPWRRAALHHRGRRAADRLSPPRPHRHAAGLRTCRCRLHTCVRRARSESWSTRGQHPLTALSSPPMPASSHRSRAASALRAFTERHGRRTLAILAVILLVGGAFRFERVINPNTDPGDDAFAYMALARAPL